MAKKRKPRNWGVVMMLRHTKPGHHGDKRKEQSRKACRGKYKHKE